MPITRFDMENQAIQRQMLAAQETIARELCKIRERLEVLGGIILLAIEENSGTARAEATQATTSHDA